MTPPTANGTILRTGDGFDVIVRREFRAPIEDVWASVTDPERTARWFGPWRGRPGTGSVIELLWAFEKGADWLPATIVACEPPRRLALTQQDPEMLWRLELRLAEADGVTTLTLTQHVDQVAGSEQFGVGWENYLDSLVASRERGAIGEFPPQHASVLEHYRAAADAAERS